MTLFCKSKAVFGTSDKTASATACLWALLVTILLFWSRPSLAQDHIVERAWFEDSTGKMTWQEVEKAPTRTYTGTLSKGFGQSAIWLKLRIDPGASATSSQTTDELVLRIRPVYLDDIRVYDPLAPGGLAGVTGDLHHPRNDKLQSLSFLVPVARGEQPRDVWVRLVSTSTRQIDVQALNLNDLNRRALTHSLMFAGYLGLIAILAIWGLVHWCFSRDAIVGAFGIAQIAALMFALVSLGHLKALWPHDWPAWVLDETATVFSITAVSAAIWFHVLLIREFTPRLWIGRLHHAMVALLPLKLCMLLLGWTTPALQLNMFEVLLAPPIFLGSVLAATGWRQPSPRRPTLARPVVIGFYAILVVMLMGASLPGLGMVNGSEIGLYIVQLHGLASALLLLLLLQYRSHVIQKQQRETVLALERSQLQIQQEREIREEQEKLLAMLAHELKTPLATMHMRLDNNASGSREIRLAIRDMNGVIERCQQTLQLSDHQLAPHPETVDMTDIVRDAASACAQPQRVQLDMPEHLPMCTDRQLWFIALNNLLENACKYAAPETPIQVRVGTTMDNAGMRHLQLEISNKSGKAGTPDTEKVFQKYYRSPHAKRQAGTGLGLYLVRNLMHVMGGSIDYTPTAGTVRFVLRAPVDISRLAAV